MEINGTQPALNLNSNLQSGDAFSNINSTGTGDSGVGTLSNSITPTGAAQTQSPGAAPTSQELIENGQSLDPAAETAFASVFFSLLQNILSEAQNNSGS